MFLTLFLLLWRLVMVNSKPAEQENQSMTIVRNTANNWQIFWLIIVSIVLHGLGLLLFARYQKVETVRPDKTDLDPIEFTVLPEEPAKETTSNDKSDYERAANLKSPSTPSTASPPAIAKGVAEPIAEPPQRAIDPTPEATKPSEAEQSKVLSGSDKIAVSQPKPQSEPQPQTNTSTSQSQPTKPTPPDGVSTSAGDLSGGDFSQTLASGGDAFFSPEALEYNSVLNPEQLKALKDIDLSQYLAAMEGKVKPNWNPSFRQDDRTTVLNFKIEKSGQVTGLKIVQSSGATQADQEALAAVQQSIPFAPLPADFPLENLEITFSFNIHIY
jgi:periplasmic protein TonB